MKTITFVTLALFALLVVSCEDEKNARIEVWLTDAPGDFQEVNIDIQGVEIHSSENDNDKGWQPLDVSARVYNLLELTNGTETFLGDLELPGGKLSQIRLKLGDENTVKIDDEIFDLNTPSAQQSGLKVQIHKVLAEGITYKVVLDFDAAKSVVVTGKGAYSLKPVIRALTEAQDGAIKGKVDSEEVVSIAVTSGTDTITTTTSNDKGEFLIRGLAEGSYKLVFGSGSAVVEKTVEVKLGEITDLGIVSVPQ